MKQLRIQEILQLSPSNEKMTLKGWIRTKRDSKNNCFFELNDGSCLKGIQIVINKDETDLQKEIDHLGTGASASFTGILTESPGKEQAVELLAESCTIIGTVPEDYPLQKKRHSFEFLRENAHLRARTSTFSAVARVRNTMSFAIHRFFQEKGFLYVHTPIITASDCEGAGEMFQVSTLPFDTFDSSKGIDYSRDFFGKKASLTVSGQLNAETYACAMGRVYTFGPTFRAENSNTTRHLAEFWMIEPEVAFCDIFGNMDLAEDFLKYILKTVLAECPEDMNFFNKWVSKGIIDDLQAVINSDFARITYTEAVSKLEASGVEFEYPVSWGKDLQSEHEKYLTEKVYKRPIIVTDYPKGIKAFYMKLNDDNKTVRAMDVLVPRLGEIIGGSERESDLNVLTNKIVELGMDPKDYSWYLDLRRFGTVPHSGFGLGFERLIQYVTGMQNIRDVIPYPRYVKNASF